MAPLSHRLRFAAFALTLGLLGGSPLSAQSTATTIELSAASVWGLPLTGAGGGPGVLLAAGRVRFARDTTRSVRLGVEVLHHARGVLSRSTDGTGRTVVGVSYDYRFHVVEPPGAFRFPIGVGLYAPTSRPSDSWFGLVGAVRAGIGGEWRVGAYTVFAEGTVQRVLFSNFGGVGRRSRAFFPIGGGVRF